MSLLFIAEKTQTTSVSTKIPTPVSIATSVTELVSLSAVESSSGPPHWSLLALFSHHKNNMKITVLCAVYSLRNGVCWSNVSSQHGDKKQNPVLLTAM